MMEKMVNEVKAIARENKKDLDRAFDMFRSNYESGREVYRGTGTYDYAYTITDEQFGELRREILKIDRKEA